MGGGGGSESMVPWKTEKIVRFRNEDLYESLTEINEI